MLWSHLVSRQVWRPVESLGRHNHRCWDLVCFHSWCESLHFIHVIMKKKKIIFLILLLQAHLVLGLPTDVERIDGSPGSDTIYFNAARWTVVIILISHSWHIKHNNKRQPSQIVEKCSIRSKRVYGPRLYPYVATNWEFIWPGPGKRYSYFIIQVPAYMSNPQIKIKNISHFIYCLIAGKAIGTESSFSLCIYFQSRSHNDNSGQTSIKHQF